MKRNEFCKTLRSLREELGYTQQDVGEWINQDKSNVNKKEKGVVSITVDEFLVILSEFIERGPSPKAQEYLSKDTKDLLKDKDGLASTLIRLASSSDGNYQPSRVKELEKMLNRYEKLIDTYTRMLDSFQDRIGALENFINNSNKMTRKGDSKDIQTEVLRRHP